MQYAFDEYGNDIWMIKLKKSNNSKNATRLVIVSSYDKRAMGRGDCEAEMQACSILPTLLELRS